MSQEHTEGAESTEETIWPRIPKTFRRAGTSYGQAGTRSQYIGMRLDGNENDGCGVLETVAVECGNENSTLHPPVVVPRDCLSLCLRRGLVIHRVDAGQGNQHIWGRFANLRSENRQLEEVVRKQADEINRLRSGVGARAVGE
jgi:hypothetical protein